MIRERHARALRLEVLVPLLGAVHGRDEAHERRIAGRGAHVQEQALANDVEADDHHVGLVKDVAHLLDVDAEV